MNQELIDLFGEYCKSEEYSHRSGDDGALDKFYRQFPPEQLDELSLDSYCLGKDSTPENFSWWIERGLSSALGRYMPGTARGHLAYKKKDGTYYFHQQLVDLSEDDAMQYIAKLHHYIANANSNDEMLALDDDSSIYQGLDIEPRGTMGKARKVRILSVYHPDTVIPINSSKHLKYILLKFGLDDDDIPSGVIAQNIKLFEIYESIRNTYNADLTPWGFAQIIYNIDDLDLDPRKALDDTEDDTDELTSEGSSTDISKNLILYGPPGTGKTYQTVSLAVSIIEPILAKSIADDRHSLKQAYDRLVNDGSISFVTFHQSFSYEDFVEGLRANTDDTGNIRYDIEDGIFKRLCDNASSQVTKENVINDFDFNGRKIWKMSLGNTLSDDAYIYDECIDNNVVALGFGENLDYSGLSSREEIRDRLESVVDVDPHSYAVTALNIFINEVDTNDLIIVSDGNHKFRAIAEVIGPYKRLDDEETFGSYVQSREVKWLKVFSPSRPIEDLFSRNLSQMSIYKPNEKAIKKDRLSAMLSGKSTTGIQLQVGDTVAKYSVVKISDEEIVLRKPNDSLLPISRIIIDELSRLVNSKKITIQDIRDKNVFEKVDTDLEKFIVNGYQNILAPLVDILTTEAEPSDSATSVNDNKVLIIDEINRGNISKIFGELITLLEPSKRMGESESLTIRLPYSKEEFSVPSNLYIVGTMNTADRSLALIDTALRRRFNFQEIMPKPELLEDVIVEGIKVSNVLSAINQRIELLYDRDHTIGHSYFMRLIDEPHIGALATIFRRQVIPLLQEYFFDDWNKIRIILADDQKKNSTLCFITSKYTDTQIANLFGNRDEEHTINQCYKLNTDAFTNPDSYIAIYSRN